MKIYITLVELMLHLVPFQYYNYTHQKVYKMHGYSQLIPKYLAKNKMRPEYLNISYYCIIHT